MRAKASVAAGWVLGLFLAAASAWGEPLRLTSPIENLETLQGSVTVRNAGQVLLVTLPSQDGHGRWFRVEAGKASSLPAGFQAESALVHFWMGHLVLIAGDKAWHFSIPGIEPYLSEAARVPDTTELAALTSGFDLKEVRVSAIYSASGPRADRLNERLNRIFANDVDHDDPGSGGVGNCGKSCTTSCGDGSSCSATCSGVRCAQCSCPASCVCN